MTNKLIGKIIKSIYLADDKTAIRFDLDNGKIIIGICYSECCSSTWIENIEDPENIINSSVISVDDLPLDDLPLEMENNDGNMIEFYGIKITTNKGYCVIDYRNESNGHYGGDLIFPSSISDYSICRLGWDKII